jgi:hypothetical protein
MKTILSSLLILLWSHSLVAQQSNTPAKRKTMKVQASLTYSSSSSFDTSTLDLPCQGCKVEKKWDGKTTGKANLSLFGELEYYEEPNYFSIQYHYDPASDSRPVDFLEASGGYDETEVGNMLEKWTVPEMGEHTTKGYHQTVTTTCHQPSRVDFEIHLDKTTHENSCSFGANFKGKATTTGSSIGDKEGVGGPTDARAIMAALEAAIHTDAPNWNPLDETPSDAEKGIGAAGNTNDKTMKITSTPTGYTISGQYKEKSSSGMEEITSYSIILGAPGYEVELVPVDEPGYKAWIPQGPDMNKKGAEHKGVPERDIHKGNAIAFHVNIYDGQSHQLVQPECIATFKLANVSKIPGWCGNYPPENPDVDNDLYFFTSFADVKKFSHVDELEVITKKEFGSADIWVVSYDYGSYGEISASVTIEGRTYPAKTKDKETFLKIPYCEDGSKIAAEWKTKNNCQKLKDADDNEELKNGLGDHEGDGFTVFEEYRGFCENRKHIRTDPLKKDVMIYDEYKVKAPDSVKNRAEDGIVIFRTATETITHYGFLEDEFGEKTSDPDEGTARKKILNFNYDPLAHSVDQHGLWIRFNPKKLGYAIAQTKPGKPMGTPKSYQYLDITADFDPGANGYATTQGTITTLNSTVTGGGGKAKIITDEFAVTVAHEMLHCCNVRHHGDKGEDGWWFGSGALVPGGDPLKTYKIKSSDTTKLGALIIGHGVPVNLYLEAAPTVLINGNEPVLQKWVRGNVGVEHGTHSGVEDCIMRYDVAEAVERPNKDIYILSREGGQAELTGLYLCGSNIGTGVNAAGRVPFSRYGNADAGRGNCKSHFCINDKYH